MGWGNDRPKLTQLAISSALLTPPYPSPDLHPADGLAIDGSRLLILGNHGRFCRFDRRERRGHDSSRLNAIKHR